MITSALLRHGADYLSKMLEQISSIGWKSTSTNPSSRCSGSMSAQSVAQPAAFERANYMRVLSSYTLR